MDLDTFDGLEYLDANSASPHIALVLHWGGASGRLGLPFARLLPEWRVIAPSLRGHGHNPPPTASADTCAEDVARLLDHLNIHSIERMYAYSFGAYVSTRLFGSVAFDQVALISGGVVPFGTLFPDIFTTAEESGVETARWLAEQRELIERPGRDRSDIEAEWEMMSAIYEDILDLSQPRLTLRLDVEAMRPALTSILRDTPFDSANRLPARTVFCNTNDPDRSRPYVERFLRCRGCELATLSVDPFDVRWDVVRKVIHLLEP